MEQVIDLRVRDPRPGLLRRHHRVDLARDAGHLAPAMGRRQTTTEDLTGDPRA